LLYYSFIKQFILFNNRQIINQASFKKNNFKIADEFNVFEGE